MDWEKAEKHLKEIRQAYTDIGAAGLTGLQLSINPLLVRFERGERTESLYDATIQLWIWGKKMEEIKYNVSKTDMEKLRDLISSIQFPKVSFSQNLSNMMKDVIEENQEKAGEAITIINKYYDEDY